LEGGLGSWGGNRLLRVSQKWDSLLRIVGWSLGEAMGLGFGIWKRGGGRIAGNRNVWVEMADMEEWK
jgi:hypothetical protein